MELFFCTVSDRLLFLGTRCFQSVAGLTKVEKVFVVPDQSLLRVSCSRMDRAL